MTKERFKTIVIAILTIALIYVLNTDYTYTQEVNGQEFTSSQKIIYYIIGLD